MEEERFESSRRNIGFFDRVLGSLSQPDKLLKAIRTEQDITQPLIYFTILTFLNGVLRFLVDASGLTKLLGLNVSTISAYNWMYVLSFPTLFIITGIFHLFVLLYQGKGNFKQTFKAYCYGFTPAYLFNWIPYIGLIGTIYGVIIFIKGLSILHSMTTRRAFLVWFTPVLIVTIILLISLIIVGIAMLSYFGGYIPNFPFNQTMNITTNGDFINILRQIKV